jgi:hypothetical protein
MNLREVLGARAAASAQKFSIYLPDRDFSGNSLESIDAWIEVAVDLLTKTNGGATCAPPSYGTWKRKNGRIIRENTRIVYSYITSPRRFERNIRTVRLFLHSFGAECKQDGVMVEVSGEDKAVFVSRAYVIDTYPDAKPLTFFL